MALCETYTPSAHCNLYPSNLPCSKYLNATTPTYVQGKYLGEQTEYAQEYNKALQEVITYLYLVLPNPMCREYLRMLLCHSIYPQCMPQNTTTGIVLDKKQKICQRACSHLQSDLCYGLNNNFKNIIMTFMSINFVSNANLEIRNEVEDFLNTLCFQDENAKVGDDNDEEENCFFEEGNREEASESCDGHGYDYKGTLDTTEYNNTCNMWTSVCLKHSYINFNSISSADRNYCRNPGGYRERPWCYVKNTTTEWEYCQLPKCPAINGNYTEWSSWSMCDASCNAQGFEFRQRNCSNPIPRFGGRNCSSIGEYIDKRSCSVTCSTDDAGVSKVYISVICAALILILLAGMGTVRMYLRKKNTCKLISYCDFSDKVVCKYEDWLLSINKTY